MPNELREVVARAIAEKSGKDSLWIYDSDMELAYWNGQADVAIAAMQAHLVRTPAEPDETLESIIAWGDATFGLCSQERAIERAGEEWQEMVEQGADVPIEAADVIICLLRIPSILEAINRKMAINRKRTWDVRPDGTGYHVKALATTEPTKEVM